MRIANVLRWTAAAALLFAPLVPVHAQESAPVEPAPAPRAIDLVICLDTSGSMDGLIDSARSRIWSIVNDLALARPTPDLRVALFSYGNNGHPEEAGWVKRETGFTTDLDLVSKRLFGFTTNGGTELVGRVLQAALTQLQWRDDPGALKLIVVAGNESAGQDSQVDYREMCRRAIGRGIMVNPIYCTRPGEDVADTWREIARLSDGHYAAIDQNATVDLTSPFDAKLAELSTALNATYVPFGREGDKGRAEQVVQDSNAAGQSANTAALRAQSKAGAFYKCNWCLVDAYRAKRVKLEDLEPEDLPEALKGKTTDEIRAYLDAKFAEREKIRKQIAGVTEKRRGWVAEELKRRAVDSSKSFDAVVRKAIRAQAAAKGFRFED